MSKMGGTILSALLPLKSQYSDTEEHDGHTGQNNGTIPIDHGSSDPVLQVLFSFKF